MNPRKFAAARLRHDADHQKQPSQLGMFGVSAELFLAAMLLAIGVHFIMTPTEPAAVGWGMFAVIVLVLFDAVRRLTNIAKGRAPA